MPCALLLGVAATTRSSTTVWKPAKPQYCLAAARITRWWPTTSFPRASRTTARTTPCSIIQNSSTDAAAPSPVHLSLRPAHRRGWGSFYAALTHGRIDAEVLRELLVRHPLSGSAETPVYAVDTSVWPRCDAETSPQRGYYYHPSRHSAGQPIVAGWAYQFVAQLNFVRESWTAPVDVERLRPAQDASEVAAEQVKALLDRTGKGRTVPLFIFDAGYDPERGQRGRGGTPSNPPPRLRPGPLFYGAPSLSDPPENIGRPRRH